MKYDSATIARTIEHLNKDYFLPSIQREFIWKPEQVEALFDSILRGYPIGSFLFWVLKDESRDKWQCYKFLQAVKHGGTRNDPASLDTVRDPVLILDGQQRLTSLLVGLTGHYTIKKKYARRDSKNSFQRCTLHMDLLHDPRRVAADPESTADMYYRLAFRPDAAKYSIDEAWYPVGKILRFDEHDAYSDHKYEEREKLPGKITADQLKLFERNLDRLREAVWREDVVAFYLEQQQDYDRVLDIFVRANEGGTKLTKSDLLLSLVTAKWESRDAREEVYTFVDHLNTEIGSQNRLSKDFVLKTALVLSELPVGFKAENFTDKNLATIEREWDGIKESIERGVKLINMFGIDAETMTSANAFIPIIYFCHRYPQYDYAHGTTPHERQASDTMRRWLITAMLLKVFSGTSDNLLRDIREVLRQHKAGEDFPVAGISKRSRQSGPRSAFSFDEETALDLVQSTWYGDSMATLVLSLTLGDDSWRGRLNHVDHVFPSNQLTKKSLREHGVADNARVDELNLWKDLLGNLQLLTAKENLEKSDKPFQDWMATRDKSFYRTHAIPEDPSLFAVDRFGDFVEAREKLLCDRLVELFRTES